MLFSSMTFLWFFLPIIFILHIILPGKIKNVCLLIASLLFYSWGEPVYVFLMIFSIIANFFLAIIIERLENNYKKIILIIDIILNIGLLWIFKYFTPLIPLINSVFNIQVFNVKNIILPIGISFYTFQILSYVIDVYSKKCEVQRNVLNFALYVSFFPQLIAGPIVKYRDVAYQIENRCLNRKQIAVGIKRFIYGLSKKVIISNTIAEVADSIFRVSTDLIDTKWLWVGTFLYTLQIYYDFSGYSDMAIGLGKMFGFDFSENFNYPYISKSIQEFWRRWHISLSSWFKEYIYIPLGGNRKGKVKTYINLSVVFMATGIWHGATFNFFLWGCFHGFFQLIERAFLRGKLEKNRFNFVNHLYTMLVVMIGWAIFRCNSLKEALLLLYHMFKWRNHNFFKWYDFFSIRSLIIVTFAVLGVGFIQERFPKIRAILYSTEQVYFVEMIVQSVMLVLCMIMLIGGQYNPFIYFKF